MKQLLKQIRKSAVVACIALSGTFLFFSCTKDDASGTVTVAVTYSLSGNATGGQAVPASSNSNGSGTISGTYNSSTKVMTYTTTWASLTGGPIAGGLYTGASGVVGASITAFSLGSGLGASGTFSGNVTLNADQESQLIAGKCYYIMSTTANASGEIRGQVTASKQ